MSGFPCSGKTTRAAELKTYLEGRLADPSYEGVKLKVEVVSDHLLNVDRSSYDGLPLNMTTHELAASLLPSLDSRSEKPARATLFTSLNRQLSEDTILIIDAMNYIKGFRYQIYCAAREAGIRTCTVRTRSHLLIAFRSHLLRNARRFSLWPLPICVAKETLRVRRHINPKRQRSVHVAPQVLADPFLV